MLIKIVTTKINWKVNSLLVRCQKDCFLKAEILGVIGNFFQALPCWTFEDVPQIFLRQSFLSNPVALNVQL